VALYRKQYQNRQHTLVESHKQGWGHCDDPLSRTWWAMDHSGHYVPESAGTMSAFWWKNRAANAITSLGDPSESLAFTFRM
jgi:hypothetical protein